MLPKISEPSIHYTPRGDRKISLIVLHNTAGRAAGALKWFQDPKSKVSAHNLVDRNGYIYQMVAYQNVAWHAMNANAYSIGIEIEAYKGAEGLTEIQETNLVALIKELMTTYKLDGSKVTTHRKVNPGRTACPVLVWKTEVEFEEWKKKCGIS